MNTTMPAGKYYVGDLCYVLHAEWDAVCEKIIDGHNVVDGIFTLDNGVTFASLTTKYGDGTYTDNQGREYMVDAGLIGCVALDKIDLENPDNFLAGGSVIEFDEDFVVKSVDGRLIFGSVEIETDQTEECDEDEGDY